MLVHKFEINQESLLRKFAVYLVCAKKNNKIFLYIGKTGDNRIGCNPLISRCGNHFSFNNMHSQIRNKIEDHTSFGYTYYFVHFDDYEENSDNRDAINKINEMERWLNKKVQNEIKKYPNNNWELLNPLKKNKVVKLYRTEQNENKLNSIIDEFKKDQK